MVFILKKSINTQNLILMLILLIFLYSSYLFFSNEKQESLPQYIVGTTNGTYLAMAYYKPQDFTDKFKDVSIKEISGFEEKVFYGPLILGENAYFIIDDYDDGGDASYSTVIDKNGINQGNDISKKILGLRNFYEITRLDPLFYSMHTDSENIRDLAATYDDYEIRMKTIKNKELQELYVSYESENKTFMFVPHNFLKILPEVVDSTERFYANPSFENAEDLIIKYQQSAYSYSSDASIVLGVLEDFVELNKDIPDFSKKIIDSHGYESATNVDTAINDMRLIVKNGFALNVLVQERKDILDYSVIGFNRAEFIEEISFPESNRDLHKIILPKSEFLSRVADLPPGNKYLTGPFEIETSCFGWDDNIHQKKLLYYYGMVLRNNTWIYSPQLSGNAERKIYLTRIQDISDLEPERLESRNAHDAPFIIEPGKGLRLDEMMDCQCVGIAEDIMGLTTLSVFYDMLSNQRIYTTFIKPIRYADKKLTRDMNLLIETIQKGQYLEQQFLDEGYPSESVLNELGKNYLNTYVLLSEFESSMHYNRTELKSIVGNLYNRKETLLEYSSIIKSRMFLFDNRRELYWLVTDYKVDVFSRISDDNPVMILDIIPYSLMFMPWSDSVWRLDEKPQYVIKKNYPPKLLIETE